MKRFLILFLLSASVLSAQSYETHVSPLPGEDLAGPCDYEITLPAGTNSVRAVWVLYDRGRDIMKFHSDPDVFAFAGKNNLALLMAHQCPGKNAAGGPEEMDMDPSQGVGRALFSALAQFADQTKHPELKSAKLILLGFSGTGALFAHFVRYAPDRIVASIVANPGHYDPAGMDRVQLSPAAWEVPEVIIAGGTDKVSGTNRPYAYFRRYRDRGAPWIFVLQNNVPHCCVINAKPFLLLWLQKIIELRDPSTTKPLLKITQARGWQAYIRPCKSEIRDTWGEQTWNACDARIAEKLLSKELQPSGWLPTKELAATWLNFVRQSEHPVVSLP